MTKKPTTLGDIFDDYETERLAKLAQEQAEYDKPENVAKRAAQTKAEHERGVRLGWLDKDGNPLNTDEESDEDEDDNEESE